MMKHVKLKTFPIDRDSRDIVVADHEFVIGRDQQCDLVLGNRLVSRHHCRLTVDGDRVFVQDLESLNGTYVNRDRIIGRCELHDGDILGVGMSLFHVEIRAAFGGRLPLHWLKVAS